MGSIPSQFIYLNNIYEKTKMNKPCALNIGGSKIIYVEMKNGHNSYTNYNGLC